MSNLSVVVAFLGRDFRINISYRASFALQTLATVFQLTLFYYLSRVVDESEFTGRGLTGGYFAYAAVGLVVLTIVQVSVGSFALKLREEQTTGTFEALVATPISPSLMVLSSAVYDLIRATVSGLLVMAAAVVLFGLRFDVNPASIGTALLALVGCLGLFASVGIAVAALEVVFKRMTGLVGMLIAGLGLLAGVYYPVEVLPAPLETVANALPLTWGIDVLRASLLGGEVDAGRLGGLFASAALLLPAALLGFTAAVRRARQTGTVGQY